MIGRLRRARDCEAPGCSAETLLPYCAACWTRTPAHLRRAYDTARADGLVPAFRAAEQAVRTWHAAHPAEPSRPAFNPSAEARAAYADRIQQGAWWHE